MDISSANVWSLALFCKRSANTLKRRASVWKPWWYIFAKHRWRFINRICALLLCHGALVYYVVFQRCNNKCLCASFVDASVRIILSKTSWPFIFWRVNLKEVWPTRILKWSTFGIWESKRFAVVNLEKSHHMPIRMLQTGFNWFLLLDMTYLCMACSIIWCLWSF